MVFSDSTGKSGLIEDITFLLGLDTNAYTLKDRTRNINERYKLVVHMILESYDGWQFIDDYTASTSTGVPYTDQNLTASTGLYTLPSAALTIREVSILNSGGTREQLTGISHEEFVQMGGDAAFPSTGVPTYYLLQGDIIRLLPIPNYSSTNGLRIYFDQSIVEFYSTDTTRTPGFASVFHRALSVGASLDYAMARGMSDKVSYLTNLWNDYEKRIREFYSKRMREKYPHNLSATGDLFEEFR